MTINRIDTTDLTTINEAEYDPEMDLLRIVVICKPADLYLDELERDLGELAGRVPDGR
jgi:hypothetical protein